MGSPSPDATALFFFFFFFLGDGSASALRFGAGFFFLGASSVASRIFFLRGAGFFFGVNAMAGPEGLGERSLTCTLGGLLARSVAETGTPTFGRFFLGSLLLLSVKTPSELMTPA